MLRLDPANSSHGLSVPTAMASSGPGNIACTTSAPHAHPPVSHSTPHPRLSPGSRRSPSPWSDAAHGRAVPAPDRAPRSECTRGLRFAFAKAVLGDMGTTLTYDYLNISSLKLNKTKNSVLQWHQPHFRCCVATCASGRQTGSTDAGTRLPGGWAPTLQRPWLRAHPAQTCEALTPGASSRPWRRIGHSVPSGHPPRSCRCPQRYLQVPGEFSLAHL